MTNCRLVLSFNFSVLSIQLGLNTQQHVYIRCDGSNTFVESLTFHFCDNSKNHFPPRYLFVSFLFIFPFHSAAAAAAAVSLRLRIICSLKCGADAEYSTNDYEMFKNLSPASYLTHNAQS